MFKLMGYVGTRANGYEGCSGSIVFRRGGFSQSKESSSSTTFQAELQGAENQIALRMEFDRLVKNSIRWGKGVGMGNQASFST